MKKIVLGIISLLIWEALPGYANMIYPGEELISIDELCAQLQKEMSDTDTSKARMDVVRKQFADLNCESVLQNAAQPADNTPKTQPSKETNPVAQPDSTNDKHNIRAYGLAGGLVVLLFGSALILLLCTRKTMKLLSAITFLMLFGGMSAWADLIAPGREFKPTPPPQIHCADGYCVARTAPQEKFSYKILYIGLGASILVIGGASFVLLRKKRKK